MLQPSLGDMLSQFLGSFANHNNYSQHQQTEGMTYHNNNMDTISYDSAGNAINITNTPFGYYHGTGMNIPNIVHVILSQTK